MTTQTQRARTTLERMASELEDTAAALRAVLAGTAEDWHLHTIGEHMTSDRYGLSFGSFDDARCPSCGAMDWTLGDGGEELHTGEVRRGPHIGGDLLRELPEHGGESP